ncbi:hypothetical protein Tsubulata_000443 [Turnera subulata]|uniref:Gamma-interferon-inducible lysosomal thiol reductase n=1 Tax=Turnera subulata TaxID=218843 RepID=A0A9Q0FZM1_9ROSI|nr:hypothetical protein Tsubulata_000443 [Turnera subulata]
MAAACRPTTTPLTTYLCVFLFIVITCSSSSSSSSVSAYSLPLPQTNKVSLALYYESLCPYSANFIVNYLYDVFQDKDLLSIVDIYLSPWGNARLRGNDIVCQHGPNECLLNTVEACAIHAWPRLEDHFPFIYCVEKSVYERNFTQWGTCFEKLGLDSEPVTKCYASGFGKDLELQYASETDALQPPHKYVPWVVVDGQPLYEDYENFLSYICKAYRGTASIKACSELSYHSSPRKISNPIAPVCYKGTTSSEQTGSAASM